MRVQVSLVLLFLSHLQQGDLLCDVASNGRWQSRVELQRAAHASCSAVLMEPLPPHAVAAGVQRVQLQVACQGDEGLEEGAMEQLSARVDVGQLVAVLLVKAVGQATQQGRQRAMSASLGTEGGVEEVKLDHCQHHHTNSRERRQPVQECTEYVHIVCEHKYTNDGIHECC